MEIKDVGENALLEVLNWIGDIARVDDVKEIQTFTEVTIKENTSGSCRWEGRNQ